MDSLDDLYQAIILEHNRSPQNFGKLFPADRVASGHNASCGDEVQLYLRFSEGRIGAIRFSGEGCAICRASASLLTAAVQGLAKEEAMAMAEEMVALLGGSGAVEDAVRTRLGQRAALLGVRQFPQRIKCATLAWHALREGLLPLAPDRDP
ncbi:MAG: SUF system NifU family Fe-S cluster assembly protein [Puniceicoccales bacterium]|nr:SUF system NifU family Fe-S cluster assembly protein [Puniceicoccales bacterium]